MLSPIGHDHTRSELAAHEGSFALLGPAGVGRSAVVAEWLGDRTWQPLGQLDRQRAFVPDVVYVADCDDRSVRWDGLLRPLEEHRLTLVAVATELPAPVLSRLPVFRVGLLSDFEVGRVLQETNRALHPRQLIAKLLGGSLAQLGLAVTAARLFDTMDTVLAAGLMADLWGLPDFRAGLFCFQAACAAVVGATAESPFQKEALARIPWALALATLNLEPARLSEAEARNTLIQSLRRCCRDG